jgi:hypothetical protein
VQKLLKRIQESVSTGRKWIKKTLRNTSQNKHQVQDLGSQWNEILDPTENMEKMPLS